MRALEERLKKLKEQYTSEVTELRKMVDADVISRQQTKEQHKTKLEKMNKESDGKISEYGGKLASLQKDVDKMQNSRKEDEERRGRLLKEIETLKKKHKEDISFEKRKKKVIEEKDGDIVKAKSEASRHNRKVWKLEGNIASLEAKYNETKSELHSRRK